MKKLSEEKVLKILKIDDFRHLTKDKVVELASMMDKMEPEVAKKALEQFPEFANIAKESIINFKEIIKEHLKANQDSMRLVYEGYNTTLNCLQKILEKDDINFEEKKYIIEQMIYIDEKIGIKDSENKKWLASLAAIAGTVTMGTLAILAVALGGTFDFDPEKLVKFFHKD